MAEIGSVIAGKYEILTEIGHGGMSVVYLAMDTHLNKQWAVKEIRKKGNGRNDEVIVNSLLAEANMMKRLDHPSLPRIVDIIDNGVTIFVVMDYIEGESLDKILAEYGAQPEELVVGWAKQLCDALSYLHSQKPPIIYRDMKPANVMLKPEGNIKIIDFGIAREYKEQNLADTTVLGREEVTMADILNTVSVIFFIAAGVFAVLAIALWFLFKIPIVIGDLSGRTAKKSIERMRLNNEKTGNKSYKTSKSNLERGKLTGTMEGMKQSDEANAETGLLNENLARDFDDQATEILVEDETMLLDGNAKTAPLDSANAITIKLIDSVKIIHTEEVI